jgi:hypothetical protein
MSRLSGCNLNRGGLPRSYHDGGPGYNFDRVALHETGHLLGLGEEQNVPSIMNVYYSESLPLGLQAGDIAGAQFSLRSQSLLSFPSYWAWL